jgi:hypothetical protein
VDHQTFQPNWPSGVDPAEAEAGPSRAAMRNFHHLPRTYSGTDVKIQKIPKCEKQEYHENTMTTFFTSRPPTAPQSTNMVHFAAPVGGNAYLGSKSCWQRYIQDHSVIHSGCFEDFSWISHVAVTFQTFSDNGNIWKWHVPSGSLWLFNIAMV